MDAVPFVEVRGLDGRLESAHTEQRDVTTRWSQAYTPAGGVDTRSPSSP